MTTNRERESIVNHGTGAGVARAFEAYGVRVRVDVDDASIVAAILDRLPPGSRPASSDGADRAYSVRAAGPGEGYLLHVDGVPIFSGRDADRLLDRFESDIQLYVSEMAPGLLFIHAGAVGWHNRAVVLPGLSFSGKSTLVQALVRAGATYYSDEYAVLDERGALHGFPRPLWIRDGGGARRRVSAEALGGQIGRDPLDVAVVVACRYRPQAPWSVERLSPGQGALALLANAVSVRRQPAVALAIVGSIVERAVVLSGQRGEAEEAASAILRLVEAG